MKDKVPPIDPKEMALLDRKVGPCVRLSCEVPMSAASLDEWLRRVPEKRRGEVGMVIVGPNGHVLIHTKPFYPGGTFRILTGGIEPHERVLHALQRELKEETGLKSKNERLLAVLDYNFTDGVRRMQYVTYLFLVRTNGDAPEPEDEGERIAEFREVDASGLNHVADSLESLPPEWDDWGRFRAIAHRVAADLLTAKT